jgi:hypothetical protein
VRALIEAHEAVGFQLASFYGPGSTASIVLKEHGEQRAAYLMRMAHAVMCAYFGGRFECSRVGPVPARKLWAYDIASAYPAAMTRLPCMVAGHGRWVLLDGDGALRHPEAAVALMRFHVDPHKDACEAWGPLPHRLPDGNIVYPVVSAGGWAWNEEAIEARRLHPGVRFECGWAWCKTCDCPPPFAKRIRQLYEWRLAVGKSGKGIVIKLALNSLYGKSAQRVGKGKFRCMVRAGLITSMTRAALLRAVRLAEDPWNILELATDSVLSREPLALESPGLGGWERKAWPGGAFLMRPGLRFALDLGSEHTAARGVNVRVLHQNRARVLRQWEREPMTPVTLQTPSFFHGAKLSVRKVGEEYRRSELYGRWTDEEKTLKFTPGPKRSAVLPDYRLAPWELPTSEGCASVAYGDVDQGALADALDELRDLEDDQPEQGMVGLL